MKISTKGRYALRFMVDLAQHNTGENIPLKVISERQRISLKYLEQIVAALSKSGFVVSTRGPRGGYHLAHHPSEYLIGDILRIIEGPLAPVRCVGPEAEQCEYAGTCAARSFWEGLDTVVEEYVNSYTLEDVAQSDAQAAGWDFSI